MDERRQNRFVKQNQVEEEARGSEMRERERKERLEKHSPTFRD